MPDVYRCVVAVRRPRAGMDTVAYQRLWAFEPGGRIGLSWSWEGDGWLVVGKDESPGALRRRVADVTGVPLDAVAFVDPARPDGVERRVEVANV